LLPYNTTDAITQPTQIPSKVNPARFLNFSDEKGFKSCTPDAVKRSRIMRLKQTKKTAKNT
jgi:hypothetical protein